MVTLYIVSLPVLACWCAHGKFAQKLLKDLFTNYTSALRPVEDTNTILNVTLQVTLSQIIDMVKHHSAHNSPQDLEKNLCIYPHNSITSVMPALYLIIFLFYL